MRDWVLRFNAKGPNGLLAGKAPGARSILDGRQPEALRQVVEDGPTPAIHGVERWRLIDLAQWVFEEFRISISKQTLSRELRDVDCGAKLGFLAANIAFALANPDLAPSLKAELKKITGTL